MKRTLDLLDRRVGPLGKAGVLGVALAAVVSLGVVDWITGSEISFSIFYLLPVSLAAWYAGTGAGLAIASASAATWLWADLAGGHVYSSPLIPYWNTAVRLGYFVLVGRLLVVLRDRLHHEAALADTDPLTGLPNARGFLEALEGERVRCVRYRRPFTLGYLDLDDFKRVNDSLGHAGGDQLLRAVAEAMRASTRRTDVVGRLGGDEFAVLLPETDAEAARPVLDKMRAAVARTGEGWRVGASLGALTFDRAPGSAAEALRATDQLMYRAKGEGKGRVVHGRSGAQQEAAAALPPSVSPNTVTQ